MLRESMDRSGVCERLGQQLQDHRDPSKVRHSLTSQLRTLIIQHAQGWDDLGDTQLLGEDPAFLVAPTAETGDMVGGLCYASKS